MNEEIEKIMNILSEIRISSTVDEFEIHEEIKKTFFVKENVSRTYDVGATETELEI